MNEFHLLQDAMEASFSKKQPFITYSIPDTNEVTLITGPNATNMGNHCFDQSGFIFAPFDEEKTTYCISTAESEIYKAAIEKKEVALLPVNVLSCNSEKTRHKKLVTDAINTIISETAEKIVVSREKEITLSTFNLRTLLDRILNAYPATFRYIWFHPNTGLWCGATPELLLKTKGAEFSTTSLAGTQKYDPNKKAVWTDKEKNEQKLVTHSIFKQLENFTQIMKPSPTHTYKAGSVVHIRTDIQGILKKTKIHYNQLTKALHPTPAVCGTPRALSKEFILRNEGYNRTFYTGFLGVLDTLKSTSEFYVNLRCMKIVGDKAYIYVGGGITVDSQPEAEWEETRNKLQTMLQVLEPFL